MFLQLHMPSYIDIKRDQSLHNTHLLTQDGVMRLCPLHSDVGEHIHLVGSFKYNKSNIFLLLSKPMKTGYSCIQMPWFTF
jgi:hypothetical protein